MADLIDRQAALTWMDLLIEDSRKIAGNDKLILRVCDIQQAMRDIVAKLNAVDAEPVVHCRDCKHLYCLSAVDRRFYCRHHPQGLSGINIVEENPYCSYGERRDDE